MNHPASLKNIFFIVHLLHYCLKKHTIVTTLQIPMFGGTPLAQRWVSLLHFNICRREILKRSLFFKPPKPLFLHSFPLLEHVAHNKDITLIVWDGSLPPGASGTLAGCLVLPASRQSSFFLCKSVRPPQLPNSPSPRHSYLCLITKPKTPLD